MVEGTSSLVLRCKGWGMKLVPVLLCLSLVGCIREPAGRPGVSPGTPAPSPQQVSSCESTRSWHNAWILVGAALSGAAGAEGSADAITTNTTARDGISIG